MNRHHLGFPHPESLRRLSSSFNSIDNEVYFDKLVKHLEPNQRIVSLSVDEMYLKCGLNYNGDKLTGWAENGKGEDPKLAKTACAIMIESLFGPMKEIVRLIPVNGLDGEEQRVFVLEVIAWLHTKGITVKLIVTDNHKINQNMFKALTSVPDATPMVSFKIRISTTLTSS